MADDPTDDMDIDHPRNPERNRGVLTRNDREWMIERPELKDSTERQKRQRIRDRLHQTILDFPLLLGYLEIEEIRRAFEPRDELEPGQQIHIQNATRDVVAILYLAGLVEEMRGERPEGWRFEYTVADGIRNALVRSGVSVEDISVSIDIQRGERLEDITGDLSEQSRDVLLQLYQGGKISSDEYANAMSARAQADAENGEPGDEE